MDQPQVSLVSALVFPILALNNSGIVGTNVVNAQGQKLGYIERISVDKSSGKINCAVISSEGFLGMRGKLFLIPSNAFRFDVENNRYALDIGKHVMVIPIV